MYHTCDTMEADAPAVLPTDGANATSDFLVDAWQTYALSTTGRLAWKAMCSAHLADLTERVRASVERSNAIIVANALTSDNFDGSWSVQKFYGSLMDDCCALFGFVSGLSQCTTTSGREAYRIGATYEDDTRGGGATRLCSTRDVLRHMGDGAMFPYRFTVTDGALEGGRKRKRDREISYVVSSVTPHRQPPPHADWDFALHFTTGRQRQSNVPKTRRTEAQTKDADAVADMWETLPPDAFVTLRELIYAGAVVSTWDATQTASARSKAHFARLLVSAKREFRYGRRAPHASAGSEDFYRQMATVKQFFCDDLVGLENEVLLDAEESMRAVDAEAERAAAAESASRPTIKIK